MTTFQHLQVPADGQPITVTGGIQQDSSGKLHVPNNPIVTFIEGDGIGSDVTNTGRAVLDAAVACAYGGKRKIAWMEVFAGDKAQQKFGNTLPKETLDTIKTFLVSIKGPLTTPVGKGIRSLNVTLRQELDLYACVRPVRYFSGVPNPMKHPEKLNVIIFRENTEDVYAGIEWKQGTPEAQKVLSFLNEEMGKKIRTDSGIGIKPMSETGSKRLVRAAVRHALQHKLPSVTLVHKGNIMKFTEGAFKEWGYEVANREFASQTVTAEAVAAGANAAGKVVVKDIIADNMFQQLLLRPEDYAVIAAPNLNGDYLSDAAAAQVGGLGIAPGANINYDTGRAVFEATHGTAPKYAGQDKANPGSFILSGVMMLEYIGWKEAADLVVRAFEKTIVQKKVTYDLQRQMEGATLLKCSEFGRAIIDNL